MLWCCDRTNSTNQCEFPQIWPITVVLLFSPITAVSLTSLFLDLKMQKSHIYLQNSLLQLHCKNHLKTWKLLLNQEFQVAKRQTKCLSTVSEQGHIQTQHRRTCIETDVVACWTSRVITVVHALLTLLTHSFQETHQLSRHCARQKLLNQISEKYLSIHLPLIPSWSPKDNPSLHCCDCLSTNCRWWASDLYTAGPVWRALSAASCSAGRQWVGCTSGSGRCEGLWLSTERSCPARWDGRCTTGSWSAALCQGSNLIGSSAARRGGDKKIRRAGESQVVKCLDLNLLLQTKKN